MTVLRNKSRRRGAMIPLIGFMIVVMILMAAIAIDVAYVQLVNMQVRKATDAAAHAGAEALGRTQQQQPGIDAAIAVAAANTVYGAPFVLEPADVELGRVEYFNGAWVFNSDAVVPNACRVNAELRPNGFLTTLGRLANIDNIEVRHEATAAHVLRDIVLVLDRSGSMAWDLSGADWSYPNNRDYCTDPHPSRSRWGAMLGAVDVFIDELDNTQQVEQLGLVTYSSPSSYCGGSVNAADINEDLTTDYLEVSDDLDVLGDSPIIGGTAISAGIDLAVDVLTDPDSERPFADKMIVLLTDGQENSGRSSLDAADDAADENITIHTITFSNGADQVRMEDVADRTGGQHFHAPNEAALIAIFAEIARGTPVVMTQ